MTTKIWLLTPNNKPFKLDPWWRVWDRAFGFVVSAESEEKARLIADSGAGFENTTLEGNDIKPWLNAHYTSCVELLPGHREGMVIRDFNNG